MSVDKLRHLEQALLAVIAAAGQRGLNVDDLCARAVGGLMFERYWPWADVGCKYGAADEIDMALEVLLQRGTAPEPETPDSQFSHGECTSTGEFPTPTGDVIG